MFLAVLTLLALGTAGLGLARRFVPAEEGRAPRAVAAVTFALGLAVAVTRLLLALGWFYLPALWAVAVAAALAARRRPVGGASIGPPPASFSWRSAWAGADRAALLPILVATAAIGLSVAAAGYLPIWAWDAAGYHLPFVNYLVQARSSDGVPPDMPYLSSYPHNAEYLFALLRLALPDDTWIDAGQIPLGIIAAGVAAATAAQWGARPGPALAAGALWLAVPGVFLQLPSGYVDVCVAAFFLLAAYWILAPVSPLGLVLSGVALGLYLGSKPSAPLPTSILFGLLGVRAWRAGQARWLGAAAAATFVLGVPDYLVSWWRFGNPVWPVIVDLGPIHLPGRQTVTDLLAAGAAAPRVEGPLLARIWRSWTSFRAVPAFDMRVGGFGTVAVLLAIPGALLGIRRLPIAVAVTVAASLLGPDPATARFILGFPALCLAISASLASRWRPPVFVGAVTVAAVLAALDLRHAAPGLAGEGPPLAEYPAMSAEERLRAVGPAGRPDRWIDLRRSLGTADAMAFDASFDLSYLLWRRQLQNRVVFVSETARPDEVERLLVRERVRFLIVEPRSPGGALVAQRSGCFRRLFDCPAQPCAVYEVPSATCLRGGT